MKSSFKLVEMTKKKYNFEFEEYSSVEELSDSDASLLEEARTLTSSAYAPYSKFKVAAVALLESGEWMKGTNQENASYPVGICAERTVLSTVGTLYPDMPIKTMAISYDNNGNDHHPISPCGMCRQALQEYEERSGQPIRLILSGQDGPVYIIETAGHLLPLAFSGNELRK